MKKFGNYIVPVVTAIACIIVLRFFVAIIIAPEGNTEFDKFLTAQVTPEAYIFSAVTAGIFALAVISAFTKKHKIYHGINIVLASIIITILVIVSVGLLRR